MAKHAARCGCKGHRSLIFSRNNQKPVRHLPMDEATALRPQCALDVADSCASCLIHETNDEAEAKSVTYTFGAIVDAGCNIYDTRDLILHSHQRIGQALKLLYIVSV